MGKTVQNSFKVTTVRNHIHELQIRLFVPFITLLIAGCAVYAFYEPILKLLSTPLGSSLYYSNPAGGFAFIMKICFTGGLIVAIPALVYNLIMFARPAFSKIISTNQVIKTTIFSTILAIAGAIFAYICVLPGALHFFSGFQVDGLNALISADDYLKFVTNIIITFVIVFQIPLLITFIDKIKPLQPQKLLKMEKWVILGSLIIALLVPFTYEFVTSLLIALPIVLLYNLSIVLVLIQHYKNNGVIVNQNVKLKITSELILNDEIVNNFADELTELEKIKIAVEEPELTDPVFDYIDIKTTSKIPETIEPADWFKEKKLRQISLNSKVQVFSDIRKPSQANRVLALQ